MDVLVGKLLLGELGHDAAGILSSEVCVLLHGFVRGSVAFL